MATDILVLAGTAATIGLLHTLFGPDHYLPFIMMAKAGKWSLKKTSLVTFLCGLGHVLSSVVLGGIGIMLGLALSGLEGFEGIRGNLAAWALIAFGLVYMVWGLRKAFKDKQHGHTHGIGAEKKMTPWILFTIFVLGPCEPLIPILMYPAFESSAAGVLLVASIFSVVTIGTMMTVVLLSTLGLSFVKLGKVEPYMHSIAGGMIMMSGLAIMFLGL